MVEVLDQATWLRTKNESLLTSLPSKRGLVYIASGIVEEDAGFQEVLVRDVNERLSIDVFLDEVEYAGAYKAVSDVGEQKVLLKITYYLGDYAGNQNLHTTLMRKEWSAMSEIRKVAAVDKLMYLSLFAKGLVA